MIKLLFVETSCLTDTPHVYFLINFADFALAHFQSSIASASNSSNLFMFGRHYQTVFILFLKLFLETIVSEFCFVL